MSKITQMKKAEKAASQNHEPKKAIVGMKADAIEQIVKAGFFEGDTVTFRYGSTADPADACYVVLMARTPAIQLKPMDLIILEAIGRSNDWDGSQNKVVTFKVGPGFRIDWFRGRVQRRIDYLDVVRA